MVNLPNTAYNGANVIMSTGSKSFSGGTYILEIPSVCVSLSSNYYQALVVYRIDNGAWNNILDWAYWGNNTLIGSVSANIPFHIDAGNHTIDIGFGTNSSSKRVTVDDSQQIKAFLVKVGF